MKAASIINPALPCLCCVLLCSCSTGPKVASDPQAGIDAWCYVTDPWNPPISFSLDEIATRTWKTAAGTTVELMKQETFRLGESEPAEILVAWFGSKGSDRTECIDFYAAHLQSSGIRYYLLCHDETCPPYKTQVALERTDPKGPSFRVSGNLGSPGAANNYGQRYYYYELAPRWRMIRHSSDYMVPPSK